MVSTIGFAQDNYKVIYKYSMEVDQEKVKEMQRNIPGFTGFKAPEMEYELNANSKESFFEKIEKIDNEQKGGEFSSSITIGVVPKGIYRDIDAKTYLKELMLDNKKYIEEDKLLELNWKRGSMVKEIAGCQAKYAEAVGKDNQTIKAWYCPSMPATGPDLFDGLPGMILELEQYFSKGVATKGVFTAISIDKNPKRIKIEKPTKGTKLSNEDVKKMSEESLKKFRERYGTGVNKKID